MKPLAFLSALILLFACKNDDAPSEETLIGTWTLETVTPQSDDNQVACDTDNEPDTPEATTTLEFLEERNNTIFEVVLRNFLVTGGGNYDCREQAIGDYFTGGGAADSLTFKRMDGNFIPPPKNAYSYRRQGNRLTLTTTDPNVTIVYEFRKE